MLYNLNKVIEENYELKNLFQHNERIYYEVPHEDKGKQDKVYELSSPSKAADYRERKTEISQENNILVCYYNQWVSHLQLNLQKKGGDI